MLRRTVLILALILALAVSARAQGEEAPGWTAWLHEIGSGRVTVVGAEGVERTITLPPEGEMGSSDIWGSWIAVAPSGDFVAYESEFSLRVLDVARHFTAAFYPISPQTPPYSGNWSGTLFAAQFDEAASRLAAGLAFRSEDTKPLEMWELIILDYGSDSVIASLNSQEVAAAQVGWLPIIQHYAGDEVTLLKPEFDGYIVGFEAYTWNTATGEVIPGEPRAADTNTLLTRAYVSPVGSPLAPHVYTHVLPSTGEIIRAARDERLPAADAPEESAFLHPNVLQAYDPAAGTAHVFYNDEVAGIRGGTFIQNGERVLACVYDEGNQGTQWTMIERDGTVIAEAPSATLSVFGTPDGFVYLEQRGTTALVHVNTRGGAFEPETVWEPESPPEGQLVIAHFTPAAEPPDSYPAWADLANAPDDETADWTAWVFERRPGCFGLI